LEKEISKFNIDSLDKALLLEAKQKGFADRQIAHMLDCLESEVNKKRAHMGIKRVYKLVDTCAAEFSASTPYYYSTFEEKIQLKDGEPFSENESKVIVLKKYMF
jgi:carbamoyl-phosphate synthase large subunit